MVNRPTVSEELKNSVGQFITEIDNDIIIVKRLAKVLSAFEVEFLLKNSPMFKI